MPVRDAVVVHMVEIALDVWNLDPLSSDRFICPEPEALAEQGLTEDDWWRAVQDLDDLFVRMVLAADWALAARLAREHRRGRPQPGAFSTWEAAHALEEGREAIFERSERPLDGGRPYLPSLDWNRVVGQAEGHWLQRFPDAPGGNDVDAEALREALLSVDEREMFGCALEAPRQRDMRALFEARSEQSRQFQRAQRQAGRV